MTRVKDVGWFTQIQSRTLEGISELCACITSTVGVTHQNCFTYSPYHFQQ